MDEKGKKCSRTYRDSLDTISKQRYDDKISLIEKQDPYSVEKQRWSLDMEKWAGVTYPDIVNFLLYSTSSYTLDELKSYKGLEAYNQFICGWVRDVKVVEINGLCLHSARVMHSQRLSETPLTPWAIIQKDGKILAAHCNCMAGLGEACTHVTAMLFSIEATVKVRDARTVTQTKAYWLPASIKGVEYSKIVDIDFSSAKSKKKILDAHLSDTPLTKRGTMQHKPVEKPTDSELSSFLNKLSLTGAQSAILSVKEDFQAPFIPKALDQRFPSVLTDLLNNDLLCASYSQVIEHCKSVQISVSKEEADCVEAATRMQAECKLWNRFRSGRITASRMYAVCHSSPASPSESLIKSICNPESAKFTSAATTWGCSHEQDAKEIYRTTMDALHDNFIIEAAGFTIHPDFPVFGASPDALVSCDCCGKGVVEIKCPYCVRSDSLDKYTGPKSCLEQVNEIRTLKRNHAYYYQVQTQLHLCCKEYADFVVWTEQGVHIERIEPDGDLWETLVKKATNFHDMAIMPELVSRFFSRLHKPPTLTVLQNTQNHANDNVRNQEEKVYCICRKGETDSMVACDNQNCPYEWFHLQCLKLTESKLPKGKWYCPECSRLPEFRPKRRCSRK